MICIGAHTRKGKHHHPLVAATLRFELRASGIQPSSHQWMIPYPSIVATIVATMVKSKGNCLLFLLIHDCLTRPYAVLLSAPISTLSHVVNPCCTWCCFYLRVCAVSDFQSRSWGLIRLCQVTSGVSLWWLSFACQRLSLQSCLTVTSIPPFRYGRGRERSGDIGKLRHPFFRK